MLIVTIRKRVGSDKIMLKANDNKLFTWCVVGVILTCIVVAYAFVHFVDSWYQ